MYVCRYVGMSEWMNECMNECMNAWMNEWMHAWMNECMNEWTNEWMNEWIHTLHTLRIHAYPAYFAMLLHMYPIQINSFHFPSFSELLPEVNWSDIAMRRLSFSVRHMCATTLLLARTTSPVIKNVRRPRPWPRQGRRLGPPQVWNFSFLAFQGHLPALKSHRFNIPLACFILQPTGTARRHKGTLACFILQPTGTPRPHINVFLWASKPAVCQPLNA